MIVRILKLFVAPLIGISGVILFFVFFLTPSQRDAIFSEVASKLPIVRNFVTKSYETHVYGLNFKDASDLKTATWAMDQLVLLEKKDKGGNIKKYYALYPYKIEAGFDLSKVKVEEVTEKGLKVTMPPVKIFSVDIDEKKGLTVIRDTLEGGYDETLQPVKVGYRRFMHDLGLQSNLLENSRRGATDYFKTFWKDIYETVEVVHTATADPFLTVNMERIPLQIKYTKAQEKKFEFRPEENFGKYDASIDTDSGSILIGLSQNWNGTYRDLLKKVKEKGPIGSTFINSFHPNIPRDSSWVGWIENGSLTGFKLHHGDLYYILSRGVDAEQAKSICADGIYIFSSVACNPDSKVNQRYKEYVTLINDARIAAKSKQLGTLIAVSDKMIQLDEKSKLSQLLDSATKSLLQSTFHRTGDSDLDIYLKAWLSTQGKPLDRDTRTNLRKLMKDDLADYYQYVYANARKFEISEHEESEARDYLIKNRILSRQFIKNLDGAGLKRFLADWVKHKVISLHKDKGFRGKGLFSDINAQGYPSYDSTKFVFYDYPALWNLQKDDKTEAYRLIQTCCRFNVDPYFIIVITRGRFLNMFLKKYDAFLLGPDHLWLIKDIKDNEGLDKDLDLFSKEYYGHLSSGADGITLRGEKYKNPLLFELLEALNSSFKGESGTKMFDELMKSFIFKMLEAKLSYPRVDNM